MPRVLAPEILDHLPVDHPAARRSRRDLRLTNALMGNHRWLERGLRRHLRPGEAALELGAGDGSFARRANEAGLEVHALDLADTDAVASLIGRLRPRAVYHFGAMLDRKSTRLNSSHT